MKTKTKPEIELPPKDGGTAVAVLAPADDLPAVAQFDPTSILAMIERAARDPTVDIDKMERLVQMQERAINRSAEQAFNESMKAAQEEMPRVTRDAKNDSTKSKYARLETIAKAINPIINKNGFTPSFGTAESPLPSHYRVTCILSHIGGHSREYFADVPADLAGPQGNANKSATHAFGSTMSYGRRYLTLLIFNIALINEDDDGNRASGDFITHEQAKTLEKMIVDTGGDVAKFCLFAKVSDLSSIFANRYEAAVAAINKAAADRRAKQ